MFEVFLGEELTAQMDFLCSCTLAVAAAGVVVPSIAVVVVLAGLACRLFQSSPPHSHPRHIVAIFVHTCSGNSSRTVDTAGTIVSQR